MIAMKPVELQEVIDSLNKGRFVGEVRAYIMSDGTDMLGYSLFRFDGGVTNVLDVSAKENVFVDGLVRAAVFNGDLAGISSFCINRDIPELAKWSDIFVGGKIGPVSNAVLLGGCEGNQNKKSADGQERND